MTNRLFQLENRISQRRVKYQCSEGYSLTQDNGVFTITGKQFKDTYVFRFKLDEKEEVLKEINRKIWDENDGLFWAGYEIRKIIRKYL